MNEQETIEAMEPCVVCGCLECRCRFVPPFAADLHDVAAEMRCRARRLRIEADELCRNSERIMGKLYRAGVIPRPATDGEKP